VAKSKSDASAAVNLLGKTVSSGVPQRFVLDPGLFLVLINNLDSALVSIILKFVDDIKVLG